MTDKPTYDDLRRRRDEISKKMTDMECDARLDFKLDTLERANELGVNILDWFAQDARSRRGTRLDNG